MVALDWIVTIIRTFFITMDASIFILIDLLFQVIVSLTRFEFIGLYEAFEQNIYVILGVFMLFKVTVSMLTYLVNPEKISDKQTGASKLVVRIIISLVMLILLPSFFDLTNEFQQKALPVIPKIILNQKDSASTASVAQTANTMTLELMKGLTQKRDECEAPEINTISEYIYHINDTCSSDAKQFTYGYIPIIPTVVGVFMLFALFSMAIQLATRVFKLLILRMVAPIPIISYIDPKSSKDGMFSTWIKTYLETWIELFINMGILYLIIYIIGYITTSGAITATGLPAFGKVLFVCFLIIGLLMFAANAPKFIMQALGIKNKGNFVRMLGMGATALGGIGSTVGSYRARQQLDMENGRKNTIGRNLMNIGASLFNGASSISSGGSALLNTDKPTLRTGLDVQQANDIRNKNRIEAGSTAFGRLLSGVQNTLGIQNGLEAMDNQINDYNKAADAWQRINTAFNSDNDVKIKGFGYTTKSGEVLVDSAKGYSTKGLNDLLDRMKNSGGYTQEDIDQVDTIKKAVQEERFKTIIADGAAGKELYGTESQIYTAAQSIFNIGKRYANEEDKVFEAFKGVDSVDSSKLSMGKDFKGASFNAQRSAAEKKSSPEYAKAKVNARESKK